MAIENHGTTMMTTPTMDHMTINGQNTISQDTTQMQHGTNTPTQNPPAMTVGTTDTRNINFTISFNCHGLKSSLGPVLDLMKDTLCSYLRHGSSPVIYIISQMNLEIRVTGLT